MAESRHYFLIQYLPARCDESLLAANCIRRLHGFLRRHELNNIGVAFPFWSDMSIGKSIGFVSENANTLKSVSNDKYFMEMQQQNYFSVSPINVVPDGLQEVQFIRNQQINKLFTGGKTRRLRRAKKRAEDRGEVFNPQKVEANQVHSFFHPIYLNMLDEESAKVLNIQKVDIAEVTYSSYCSYGFASKQLHRGSVPDLSSLI